MRKRFMLLVLVLLAACASAAAQGKKETLSFESFDGGGPEYYIRPDTVIVSWEQEKKYERADHEELNGAGYTVTFIFTGVEPGETRMTVEECSPLEENLIHVYDVKVDQDLNVSLRYLYTESPDRALETVPTLVISANDHVFYGSLEENPSAAAFTDKLSKEPAEIEMHDSGSFGRTGELPWELEQSASETEIEPGDILLLEENRIMISFGHDTRKATRLGTIGKTTEEELSAVLGEGDVTVTFWVEWSE